MRKARTRFVAAVVSFAWAALASGLAMASAAETAAHAVLERVIGAAAASQITLTLTTPAIDANGAAIDTFTIGGSAGNIAIEATTPSALTQGAGWYLKYVAHAD